MAISKLRRKIIQDFLKERQQSESHWECCNTDFSSLSDIGRHVHRDHVTDLDNAETLQLETLRAMELYRHNLSKLRQRRGEKGSSDPISVDCQCPIDTHKVILFYRYTDILDPVQFSIDHQLYCKNMTGKVRIASEGINATLAGTNEEIDLYLDWLTTTQPFRDLTLPPSSLSDPTTARYQFFKPSAGCKHVFGELSIKFADEICPLGQTSVVLQKLSLPNHREGKLAPPDFHAMLTQEKNDFLLLDTRNYYESKIGKFRGAVTPAIRKFSQFPDYIQRNEDTIREKKKVLTYCTGGIRCEKATAFMRQALPDTEIFMLDGGIHNYMEWCKTANVENPVWEGKNYVFDARQSLGLEKTEVISQCQVCAAPWDQYTKCSTPACHLLILMCDHCIIPNPVCCITCDQDQVCQCEQQRRKEELQLIS
ncbi:Rhodanese-like domain-containing protein [Mucor mucedo]|uniref:Rhodanese-like domain-containing protein n=1 Tax=Mucor mucedo TaxID=29922 RepID=UPI00221E98EB|nr:Rhodanese-like domain-containing protein [Mucor mucedo]KAI7889629.1 Rhodanese-like domain-containing protein [Mucor mucedo]